MALICKKWHEMERATRKYLCIRGISQSEQHSDLWAISKACRNLEELFDVGVFNPRYMDCVGMRLLLHLPETVPRS
jgi:hypothetical protein